MMNYTKSEFYRIFITKGIYATAGLLAGIALLLNAALYFSEILMQTLLFPIPIWWQILWFLPLWE